MLDDGATMSTGDTALPDVQESVIARLRSDATLQTLAPGGVWDYAPMDPVFPNVVVEDAMETSADTFGSGSGSQGRSVMLTLTVFSLAQGRAEQFVILRRLVRLLRHQDLAIDGWDHLLTEFVGAHAISPFAMGDGRAGATTVKLQIDVRQQ
jgi:hypothetical protein